LLISIFVCTLELGFCFYWNWIIGNTSSIHSHAQSFFRYLSFTSIFRLPSWGLLFPLLLLYVISIQPLSSFVGSFECIRHISIIFIVIIVTFIPVFIDFFASSPFFVLELCFRLAFAGGVCI
jgi:hypothetical protein